MKVVWRVPRSQRNVCHDCGAPAATLPQCPRVRIVTATAERITVESLCRKCWEAHVAAGREL